MNRWAGNNIVLFTAFFYLVFACLYVVACGKNNNHPNSANGVAVLSAATKSQKGGRSFLSRPRVLNQKLVNNLILPATALCLFIIMVGSLTKPVSTLNIALLIQRPSKFILLKNLRL